MNKLITFILAFMCVSFCYPQNFEGVVKYELEYELKSDNYSHELIEEGLGKHSITYFKDGFYKEITDSKFMAYQLFRHDKKQIYYKHNISDDTLRFSSTIASSKTDFSSEIYTKTDTILGVVCDKLVVQDARATKTYYYSSIYSTDPKFYIDYTVSNKYEILKLMKAIYLRLDIDYEDFFVSITAVEVRREKLDQTVFEIPEHSALLEE